MKHTHKRPNRKLDRATARIIIGTRGMSREIARITGYSKSYVSEIVHGRWPAPDNFLAAMLEAVVSDADRRQVLAIQARHGAELAEK